LHVKLENPDDTQIISEYKPYLDKKTQEVFGRKIDFNFASAETSEPAELLSSHQSARENDSPTVNEGEEDPLINAVIKELGGREIKDKN